MLIGLDRYELIGWSLDFEGCLTIERQYRRRGGRSNYRAKVVIDNCSLSLLQTFQKRVELGIVNPSVIFHENGNDSFRWRLGIEEIRQHMANIQPFFHLKRRQGEILLELLSLKIDPNSNVKERDEHYTPTLQHQLDSLYWEIRELNAKTLPTRTPQEEFYRALRKR